MLSVEDGIVEDRSTRKANKNSNGHKRLALGMLSAVLSHLLKTRPRVRSPKDSASSDKVVDEGDAHKVVRENAGRESCSGRVWLMLVFIRGSLIPMLPITITMATTAAPGTQVNPVLCGSDSR